jgi:VCBS repeat-containing protein
MVKLIAHSGRALLLGGLIIFSISISNPAETVAQSENTFLPMIVGGASTVSPPPVANDDAYVAIAAVPLEVNPAGGVLANDTDPHGRQLSAVLVSDPDHGTLTLDPDGSFTYTPAAGFSGSDQFTYRVGAGPATSEPATVTLTVKLVNSAPLAQADSYQTDEGAALAVGAAGGVLANDTDPDADPLQATLVAGTAHGALELRADGSFNYAPQPGYSGQDTFTYTAGDGLLQSGSVTVTITVTPLNDAPRFVTGQLGFTKRVIGTGVLRAHIALGADLDGDGDMDITATDYENGRMLWYENDGGDFTERLLDGDLAGAYPAAVGDVDGDGDADVLAAGYLADTFVWYRADHGGNFTRFDIDTESDGAHSIVPVDLDQDGDIDLITSSQDAGTIAWYENDGAQNFERHLINTDTPDAKRAEVADMDGDGDLDIVTAEYKRDTIAWLENDGAQNFAKHPVYHEADGAYYAFPADLDGDGDQDILSASKLDGTIGWHRNDGAGEFFFQPLFTKALGARSVIAADLDGDGDMDALSAALNTDTVAWFENDGQGNFTRRPIATDVRGAYGVSTADMDLDGDLDVLSAARNANEVALHTAIRAHSARITKGSSLPIDASRLSAVDADDGPAELTYTLTVAPARGELLLDGVPLAEGGSFTQADVDNGLLAYAHGGADMLPDRFDLNLADGGENGVGPASVRFTIEVRAGS